jgi:hypothetical protein
MVLGVVGVTTRSERGAILVEFALVALVTSLLLAVSVDFGRLLFSAQGLQDVARVAAREFSVTPVDPTLTFDQALDEPQVVQRVYDKHKLAINLDDPNFDTDAEVDAYFADEMPVVNRALRPLMIVDLANAVHPRLLRYPGAVLADAAAPSGFTVGIPRVTGRDANGVETIEWVPVLEEIRIDPCDPSSGPFGISSASPMAPMQRGLVAVRLNYPYQAGALTAYKPNPAGPFQPNLDPITADEGAVSQLPGACAARQPPGALLGDDPTTVGAYAGPFGLGRQFAFVRTVRPFRKLISAQAIYRREVFE